MPISRLFPRMRVLNEGAGTGLTFGLLHAVAETTFLGWNGIRPSTLDLAIIFVFSIAVGVSFGFASALAVSLVPVRKLRSAADALAFRQAVWVVVFLAYLSIFLKLVSYWEGWTHAIVSAWPAVPFAALALIALRRAHRVIVPFSGAALVATVLCGLQLIRADWTHQTHAPGYFDSGFALFAVLAALGVALAFAASRADKPFETYRRAIMPMSVVVGAWACIWIMLGPSFSFYRGGPASTNPSRPNFILIVLDTVGAGHLDLFGYERKTMPHLRTFAETECQVAQRMITTAPWTLPSHASMFTGLYSFAHGAHDPLLSDKNPSFFAYPVRQDVPTLAEFLSRLGYETGGIVANYAALSGFGIPRGFQSYDVQPGAPFYASRLLWFYRLRFGKRLSLGSFLRSLQIPFLHRHSVMFSVREPQFRRAGQITDEARHWLSERRQKPFFLFLNYLDAHDPYLPAARDDERFASRPVSDDWFGFPEQRYRRATGHAEALFSEDEKEFLKAQYDASLVSLDRELSRLWDYLKDSGFYENTIVFVTTDHGESFLEHGVLGHGTLLNNPQTGGFLLVRAPSFLGQIDPSPAMQSVDFFPTIADILGEEAPQGLHGSPWGKARDYALSEQFCRTCGNESVSPDSYPEQFRRELVAVAINGQKLIRSTSEPDKVYRSFSDPLELEPVSDPDPEFVSRADKILAERKIHSSQGDAAGSSEKDMLERLRSLGYIK